MRRAAFLEVRVLPWRPRRRAMERSDPDVTGFDPFVLADDVAGFVVGLVVWLLLLLAAPVLLVVLSVLFLPVEIVLVAVLAAVVVLARLLGVVPWVVLVVDLVAGTEEQERYRNLLRAVRRLRDVNHDRRVAVRWAWT